MTGQTIKMTPELRFPEFSGEWQVKKLGDVASFIKDGTHGTHTDDPNGRNYLLSAKNLQNGTIAIDDSDRKISQTEFDSITKKYTLKTSDILLSIVGTIGRVSQIPEKYINNTAYQRSVAFLRFGMESDEFIVQLFNGREFQNELQRRQVVSAQPGIYLGDIAKIEIKLPQKPEQEKIAEFLTAVDARIVSGEQKLASLTQYKKAVMQQIFSQQIRFKDENGDPYPEWQEKRLGELVDIKTGKKDVNQGNPNGKYPFFTCAREHTYSDGYSFDGEAIMIAGNGEVGLCAYYNGKFEAYQRTYVLQDFKVPADYLYIYLKEAFQAFAESQKQQGSMPYIKLSTLQDFKIPVQSYEEQQKIATFLTALDARITAETTRLEAAKEWKKGLLQRMFV